MLLLCAGAFLNSAILMQTGWTSSTRWAKLRRNQTQVTLQCVFVKAGSFRTVFITKWFHGGDGWHLLMIPRTRLTVLSLKPSWFLCTPPLASLCLFWRLRRRMERGAKSHLTFRPGDLTWGWNCVVRIERQRMARLSGCKLIISAVRYQESLRKIRFSQGIYKKYQNERPTY